METGEVQALLARTPAALDALLSGLPESWTSRNSGAATWSARDIVAHLIHGELEDWVPRARLILEHGAARTFDPFDPEGFHALEGDRPLADLLPRFANLRVANLAWLGEQNFTATQLELRGTHPAFGEVTLGQLLSTWAAHDLSHIAQIARVLAHPLGDGVGPWAEYLPIVRS